MSATHDSSADVLRDQRGRAMFVCPRCGGELTSDDVVAQDLRLPDFGETRDEYCGAELVDDLSHIGCMQATRAS